MEEEDKKVLCIKLSDDVKKISITYKNGEEKVIVPQELSEDELEQATGGSVNSIPEILKKGIGEFIAQHPGSDFFL